MSKLNGMTDKPGPFPWGRVIRIHEIGEYQFTEYHPWVERGKQIANVNHIEFHYEEGRCGTNSLDGILIKAICQKYDGPNERLSGYIYKALGMKGEE